MLKKRFKFLLLLLSLLILVGCNNNVQPIPTEEISATPVVTDDVEEDDELSVKYKLAVVGAYEEILNEHYKEQLIHPFEYTMVMSEPFIPITNRYDGDGITDDGRIMAVAHFLQGIIKVKNNVIIISIVQDKTFDNGGYLFTNTCSLYSRYFDSSDNDKYTMSMYKYKKCYVVFEFYNPSLTAEEKTDFIKEFSSLLKDNYSEMDKNTYNEDDSFYIPKIHMPVYFDYIQEAFNEYYKENITSQFKEYTKSEIPLFEIDLMDELEETVKEYGKYLALTKYTQGIVQGNKVKITFVDDLTDDNNGFVYTTDPAFGRPSTEVYRYNKIFIILEFCDSVNSLTFYGYRNTTITSVAKVLAQLEKQKKSGFCVFLLKETLKML